jgi:glycosyltransferase involved in cell wall biosynthesis
MAKSLYICYFGMREPLVQTQVLPYLREVRKDGHEISLLTFEPANSALPVDVAEELRVQLSLEGIDWHTLRYHKRFSVLATAYDIFCGALLARRMIGQKQLDILHARVHVPALMAAIARKLSSRKPKILFDIRGFMPEEYTDAGVWPEGGWLYRIAKRVERWLLREADGFVVLTERARDILFPESKGTGRDRSGRPVEVIPCCVDLARFNVVENSLRDQMRADLGISERFVIVYVGSFGGWYMTDEMIELFVSARKLRPDAFAMILTQRDKETIKERLRSRSFGESDFLVRSVTPDDIPSYLGAADTAVSFIKACYSKQSSSPTKIAEYLAGGLPIIANRGVGDVDSLLESNNVGILLGDFAPASINEALERVNNLGDIRDRCKEVAKTDFDLAEVAGTRYRRLYRSLDSSGE